MIQAAIDFDAPALSRKSDPETSRAAAAKVDAPSLSARVLAELRANGPGTSHELAERLGLSLVTVSPRMRPLAAKNKVREKCVVSNRIVWEVV